AICSLDRFVIVGERDSIARDEILEKVRIIARATVERVIAAMAAQLVVAAVSEDHVGAGIPMQVVITPIGKKIEIHRAQTLGILDIAVQKLLVEVASFVDWLDKHVVISAIRSL